LKRVVADTNIFISALQYGGQPAKFFHMFSAERFILVVTEPILAECEEVLSRKFRWDEHRALAKLEEFRQIAEMVDPALVLTDCSDPDDNRILEAAVAGLADCIVSGDKHLLRMKKYHGIDILTVTDFLKRLGS
jgi:putative PIN family toxin of toxin-antitoxin system